MTFSPHDRIRKDFTIHTFDIDPHFLATPSCLFRYMQEVAIMHVDRLGLGLCSVARNRQAWVLAKMLLEVAQLPRLHEVVTVETWSSGVSGQFALREHTIKNSQGTLLAAACSHWLLLDKANNKICRLSETFGQPDSACTELALGRSPKRIKAPSEWRHQRAHAPRYSELDFNGHVNHIRYIEHALDMVPVELRQTHGVCELEVEFLQESGLNDPLTNRLTPTANAAEFVHSLFNNRIGKNAFSARSAWRPLLTGEAG